MNRKAGHSCLTSITVLLLALSCVLCACLAYLVLTLFQTQPRAVEIKQHATAPPVHAPACFLNTAGLQVLTRRS